MTDPKTYLSMAAVGVSGGVLSDLAAGAEGSILFGSGYFGWTGYLNGNAPWGSFFRVGYGWDGTQGVFRIGGSTLNFLNNPHIDLWPPSAW